MTTEQPGTTAGITELAEHIQFLVGAWHDFGYEHPPTPTSRPIPPLGQRSAEAIRAGHSAVQRIDELSAQLSRARSQLVSEMRQDADLRAAAIG